MSRRSTTSSTANSGRSSQPSSVPGYGPRATIQYDDPDDDIEEEKEASSASDDPDTDDERWGDEVPNVVIRSPRSTEELAARYTAIKPSLEEFLCTKYESYFFVPVVVSPKDQDDIPVLVIIFDVSVSDELPTPNQMEPHVGDYFVIMVCRGQLNTSSSPSTHTQRQYHKQLMSGDSIQVKDGEHGTLGLFVQEDDKITGITCGHLFKEIEIGSDVCQPSLADLQSQILEVERQLAVVARRITMSTQADPEISRQRQDLETQLADLKALKGDNEIDTKANLCAGRVISWELRSVRYKNRRCYADWGLMSIAKDREPLPEPFNGSPSPEETDLYGLTWDDVSDFGELDFDMRVRKSGQRTGVTFGCVAGVHAGWINPKIRSRACSEYYVLQERRETDNFFAKRGDSGAAVITNDGDVVGFVHCSIEIQDVQVVCRPGSTTPDLRKIAERRDSAGEVDLHQLWFTYFVERSFVLIECATMVRDRARIAGTVFPNS